MTCLGATALRRAALAFAFVVCALFGHAARAQHYPTKPIDLYVGYPAGGASGQIARIVGASLSQALGQPVKIVEKVGNDGILAATAVAKAAPDGYSLLLTTTGMVTFNQFIHKDLPYDPQRDFVGVSLLADIDNVLVVRPEFAAQSIADIVRLAKAAPGKIVYARQDVASTSTLAMFLFENLADVELAMPMTWTTIDGSLAAVIKGDADLAMYNLAAVVGRIKAGKIRALATTGRKRNRALPNVPTIGETIADYRANAWFGIVAPHGTPREIVRLLNGHISRALAQPSTQAQFDKIGADTVGGSPDEFEVFIQSERTKWRRVTAAAKIVPQ